MFSKKAEAESSSAERRPSSIWGRKKEEKPYDPEKYGEVNQRFILGCQNDKDPIGEAQRRWMITVDWREEEKINTLMQEPQPFFHDIKAQYPHYYHNRARNGNFVYYERPGLSDYRPTLKAKYITIPETIRHYLFISEWLWVELDPREDGKLVSVWDVTGVTASDLAGDTMRLMSATIKVMGQHYPERTDKLFIVNAPRWFTTMWRIISPMIDPNTKKKIKILGDDFHSELFEHVAPENVPMEFGGLDPTPLGESTEEKQLRKAADRANGGQGSSYAVSLHVKGVFGAVPDPPAWQIHGDKAPSPAPSSAALSDGGGGGGGGGPTLVPTDAKASSAAAAVTEPTDANASSAAAATAEPTNANASSAAAAPNEPTNTNTSPAAAAPAEPPAPQLAEGAAAASTDAATGQGQSPTVVDVYAEEPKSDSGSPASDPAVVVTTVEVEEEATAAASATVVVECADPAESPALDPADLSGEAPAAAVPSVQTLPPFSEASELTKAEKIEEVGTTASEVASKE